VIPQACPAEEGLHIAGHKGLENILLVGIAVTGGLTLLVAALGYLMSYDVQQSKSSPSGAWEQRRVQTEREGEDARQEGNNGPRNRPGL
jgi:hypothetical protein